MVLALVEVADMVVSSNRDCCRLVAVIPGNMGRPDGSAHLPEILMGWT